MTASAGGRPIFGHHQNPLERSQWTNLFFLSRFVLPDGNGRRQSCIDDHLDQITSRALPGQKIAELQPIEPASRGPHRTADVRLSPAPTPRERADHTYRTVSMLNQDQPLNRISHPPKVVPTPSPIPKYKPVTMQELNTCLPLLRRKAVSCCGAYEVQSI